MSDHPPLKILLVEDNLVNQLMAQGTLAYLGHEVVVASNGLEAVNAFKEFPFELILMDLSMPVMDGFEASAQILAYCKEQNQRVPVIVALSASLEEEDKDHCREVGVTRWLGKPISPDEFSELTRSLSATTPPGNSTDS